MEPKGKTLLKVTGVLLIIGAILAILLYIMGLTMGGVIMSFATSTDNPALVQLLDTWLIAACVVGMVLSIIQLLAGICGVRNCKNVGAAKLCFNYGIVLIIFAAASIFMQFFTGVFQSAGVASTIGTIVGLLVLPVLYTLGAVQNKKEA